MTFTLPGLGELAPVEGAPDGVSCWTTTIHGTTVAVLVEEPSTVEELDPAFIEAVLADREHLLAIARAAVAEAYGPAVAKSAAEPEFTFHTGQDWVVRFAECAEPGYDELGVLVVFEGHEVTEVDDLADED